MTTTLKQLVLGPSAGPAEVAEHLDRLPLGEAIAEARGLGGRRVQRALWNVVEPNPRVSVTDFVPPDYEPMKPVIFHGKNSLPAFTEFQKICCRPPTGRDPGVLWGYNESTIKSVIGPGYYVVHDTETDPFGGAAFDYRAIPKASPPGWPDLRPNSAGLSRFIYNNMVDYMRRVSRDVFIGSATRGGKEMGSYFVLVREIT